MLISRCRKRICGEIQAGSSLRNGKEKLKYDYTNRNGDVQHRNHSFEGIIPNLERRYQESNSDWIKGKIEELMNTAECTACSGRRLRPELLAVTVGNKNISEFCDMSVAEAIEFLDTVELSEMHRKIAAEVIREIRSRLQFLSNVGLDYLTLSRASQNPVRGRVPENQTGTQVGSGLVGVTYILDEPSIGLHQKDNEKLLKSLRGLYGFGELSDCC